MANILLYLTTIAIWGSSFFAISYQISHSSAVVSVFYRFIFAALLMLILCMATRRPINIFTAHQHCMIAVQGAFLFCINFWLIYEAAAYITSGLIATIFSTIVVMNIVGGALVFKTKLNPRMFIAAALGFIGIASIFWPEISSITINTNIIIGLSLALGGTVSASVGMLMSAWFQNLKLPIIPSNTFGMAYGAFLAGIIAMFNNERFVFVIDIAYILSFGFLVLFASVIAFWSFLTLIGRIGPGQASYAMVFFPLLSLTLSTVFENYQWSVNALIGALLVMLGNSLILQFKKK